MKECDMCDALNANNECRLHAVSINVGAQIA